MTRSDSISALVAALVKAQPNIKAASKSSVNPHFKSKYADLAEVEDACVPALNTAGIAVLQPVRADGLAVTVTTMLAHTSGEWLAEDLTLTAVQNTPQAIGSAITYGRRYGLAAMVGVAPEDDDGNAASRSNGSGYSVSAPAALASAASAPVAVGIPSVPNGGDSGHSHAPDVTRPPAGGSAPPAGCYRILQVQKQTGKVKGEVILVDHHGQEQKLPAFQDQLVALAERLCQDGVPVEAQILVAATSQKPYLKNLRAALPEIQVNADVHTQPLTDKDIPFMWLLPLIGPAFGLLALSRSLLS